MKSKWNEWFLFNQKEQKGIVVICTLLGASVLVHLLFATKDSPKSKDRGAWMDQEQGNTRNESTREVNSTFFNFDPNLIDEAIALKLGLSVKQYNILHHYRSKGGVFKTAQDIYHLYGLQKPLADQLFPYVVIDKKKRFVTPVHKDFQSYQNNDFKKLNYWQIQLNDTLPDHWKKFRYLSDGLIFRIIHYGKIRGGYDKLSQLKKVYGISDTLFNKMQSHLVVSNRKTAILNAHHMNYEQWISLGLFSEQEVWKILRYKKKNGGFVGWKGLTIELDLTQSQVEILRSKIDITD
jgi:hypothetical protein